MQQIITAVLAVGLSAASAVADGRLIVINKGEDTASIIDGESLTTLATLPTGGNPHEVHISPDGRYAYVSDYGMSQGNSVTVLDLETLELEATWSLGEFTGPHGIWASADGDVVWVTAERSNAVVELDARSGAIVRSWDTGQRASHQLAVAPDGSKIFVANIVEDTFSIIDRSSDEVITIGAGQRPEALDVSPDGRELWLGQNEGHEIRVYDTLTGEEITRFNSGGEVPIRLKFTPDGGQVFVSNANSALVTVFDAASREQLASIDVGAVPVGIQMETNGHRAFVANMLDGFVTIIDRNTHEVIGRIEAGDQPDGLAWVETD